MNSQHTVRHQVGGVILNRISRFHSIHLQRDVCVDIYYPEGKNRHRKDPGFPFLILNDGQDLERVGLIRTLETLWAGGQLPPLIAIGVYANEERLQEYGTAGRPDYKGRGSKADAYTRFVARELLPWLRGHYHLSWLPKHAAIAGFSLGGLSAMDIAWQQELLFGKVGVFSGSFWWRSAPVDPADPDAHRIMHEVVAGGPKRNGMSFWFQAGTKDEEEDRNNNGIIDAIDDTLDLIRELENLGYQRHQDIRYVEVQDGEHNPETWAGVMPDFLKWAFGDPIDRILP